MRTSYPVPNAGVLYPGSQIIRVPTPLPIVNFPAVEPIVAQQPVEIVQVLLGSRLFVVTVVVAPPVSIQVLVQLPQDYDQNLLSSRVFVLPAAAPVPAPAQVLIQLPQDYPQNLLASQSFVLPVVAVPPPIPIAQVLIQLPQDYPQNLLGSQLFVLPVVAVAPTIPIAQVLIQLPRDYDQVLLSSRYVFVANTAASYYVRDNRLYRRTWDKKPRPKPSLKVYDTFPHGVEKPRKLNLAQAAQRIKRSLASGPPRVPTPPSPITRMDMVIQKFRKKRRK
jgi:hypothetical protein